MQIIVDPMLAAEISLHVTAVDMFHFSAALRHGCVCHLWQVALVTGSVTRGNVAQVLAMAAISPASSLDRVVEVVELGTCVQAGD